MGQRGGAGPCGNRALHCVMNPAVSRMPHWLHPQHACSRRHRESGQHLGVGVLVGLQNKGITRSGAVVGQIGLNEHVGEPRLEPAAARRRVDERFALLMQMAGSRGLGCAVGRAKRGPHLCGAKGQRGAVHAPAPGAGTHCGGLQLSLLEPFADAPGLCPACVAEIALRTAVAQAHAGRIERAGRKGVAKHHHHAPFAQQGLCVGVLCGPTLQGGKAKPCRQQGAAGQCGFRLPAGRHSRCRKLPCAQMPGTGSDSRPTWRCWQ